ncbi:hypothetical protein BVC80_9065g46 [Macleaya cordata]|uniref:PHD-type zinc finger plants domain-containing protein n=1 Tax=Macleaya cordata TaxID=56857 RepID=A0A200PNJ2_MACCD|nr:hypothetical protein BVC80_9065g46 [Macleaya cordata]
MCGDYGLPYELFRCNLCYFRSQHSYCSNLYPKAQSYRLCNWCLNKDEGNSEGTHNNSSSSLSNKYMINNGDDHHQQKYISINSNEKINNSNITSEVNNNQVSLKIQIRSSSSSDQLHNNNNNNNFNNKPIKKQRCLDRLSSSSPRSKKIIISHTADEESLRRTKSEEISNTPTATTPKQKGLVLICDSKIRANGGVPKAWSRKKLIVASNG